MSSKSYNITFETMKLILDHYPGFIMLADAAWNLEYVSPSYERLLGYMPDHFSQLYPHIHPEDLWKVKECCRHVIHSGRQTTVDYRFRTKDNDWIVIELSFTPVKDERGTVERLVIVKWNVTDIKNREQLLKQMALYDLLTRLPNRRLLEEKLSQDLEYAKKHQMNLALACMDCDNFKAINDRFGHDLGDRFLQMVARRISENIRETDTLARWGGDEFVLLLPAVASEERIRHILERIMTSLKQPWHVDGQVIKASISIGVATFPRDGSDGLALLRCADLAMYRAKQKRGPHYCFYSELDKLEPSSLT